VEDPEEEGESSPTTMSEALAMGITRAVVENEGEKMADVPRKPTGLAFKIPLCPTRYLAVTVGGMPLSLKWEHLLVSYIF
jgi:hypothetical protein